MIITTKDLANQLNVAPQTITRNAVRHGIGRKIGSVWVFTPAEAEKLARILRDNTDRDYSAMGKAGMRARWAKTST